MIESTETLLRDSPNLDGELVAKKTKKLDELATWHAEQLPLFNALAAYVKHTISTALSNRNIQYLYIKPRVKQTASFIEKISTRKKYSEPKQQNTDFVGLRIVTYLEADVELIDSVIRELFRVHEAESGDRSKTLGSDRVGYRSLHLVCDIGEDRCKLAECAEFRDLRFEVQIRTALQDAWAQIEWSRRYKFSGELPAHFARRLSLLAGALELIDGDFSTLVCEIDAAVKSAQTAGQLNAKIDTISLESFYINDLVPKFPTIAQPSGAAAATEIVQELRALGYTNIPDLNALFSDEFIVHFTRWMKTKTNIYGLFRDAMLFSHLESYFERTGATWRDIDSEAVIMLREKHGSDTVSSYFNKHSLTSYSDYRVDVDDIDN